MQRGNEKVARRLTAGKPALVVAALAVTVGAAWAVYQETMAPGPLESMVPESAAAFGSADARWIWSATADLRQGPKSKAALASFEREMHVSVQRDILPWAGQVAGAALTINPKQPQGAFFIEVRNPVQYYATMSRLRTRMEQDASRYWKPAAYNGVPLRYTTVRSGKRRISVSTAWLKGWVVVGVGEGSTKRVIDAWQGRKPSVAMNFAWSSPLSRLPEARVMWGAVNGGAMATMVQRRGLPMKSLEMSKAITAMAMTDLEDGFRIATSSVATSAASKGLYARLGRNLPPVTEDVMDRLPDGTFLSFALTEPGVWWDVYEPMLKDSMPKPATSKAVQNTLQETVPLQTIVRRAKGLAIGVSYREQAGFGLELVGDFGTPEAARQSAEDLRAFVQSHRQTVTQSEDGMTYRIMKGAQQNSPVTIEPMWQVGGSLVTFASQEAYLAPATGAERIPLPVEAQGAQMVSKGDFRFVEPVLSMVPQSGPAAGVTQGLTKGWQRTGLAGAHWWTWSRIHSEGSADGIFELRGWQWRSVLRSIARQQRLAPKTKPRPRLKARPAPRRA